MTEKLAGLKWVKRWGSPFRLWQCSYWGEQYWRANQQVFSGGFKHILFTHQDGISNCYRVQEETSEFGKLLASKVSENPALLVAWSGNLKKEADALRSILAAPVESFLDITQYEKFERAFESYHPMAVANNTVVDYVSEELIGSYGRILGEARTYTESVYNETEQFCRTLAEIVAKRENRNPLHMSDLYYDEFKQYLKDGALPAPEIMDDRYAWSGLYFVEGKRNILTGDEVVEFEQSLFEQQHGTTIKEVSGKTASPGKARGMCRIVPHPSRVTAFNEGDILVTSMTRPNFVPLMQKSGAIVTDAGGLLSHAAIVARELKKPCVIGTEVATKVFHDGDLLEVDANNGTVKIVG